jgi:hypothetical protein
MHPYIENIVDVNDDNYCGYRVVDLDNRNTKNNVVLIKLNIVRELSLPRPHI